MGITVNGPSGIDTASLIDQLVALEQQRVTKVEKEKSDYQVKIDGYSKLKSYLSDISSKAIALNAQTSFDLFKVSSSSADNVTVQGGVGAAEGNYDLTVFHLAKNEKMISKDAKITSQTAALSTMGVTTGDISIDGTKITISNTDTIQDLRMKINNATDANGNKLGVTASVLKISDNNFRLVLTAKDSGSKGVAYKDETGSTLTDLGIINDISGSKGNAAQVLTTKTTAPDTFQTMFDSLTTGATISYAGLDHDGNKVTNTYIKPANNTSVDEFLAQIKSTFHNMADVAVDSATGQMSITDKVSGASQISLTSLTMNGTSVDVGVTQAGKSGNGVLNTGSDAFFNLDGLYMNNASNNPTGVLTGVTMQFHKASVDSVVNVSLERDVDGVQKKVQDLLDSYNSLLKYASDSTHVADPSSTTDKSGDLAGDMTVNSIVSQVRTELKSQFNLFGGSYNSLTMIGVNSDSKTGEMSIDSDKFKTAVTTKFDEFARIFVTTSQSDNKNVIYGRSTAKTLSGSYTLREVDADHMEIKSDKETTWTTSDSRVGDVVTFSSGSANGLSITAPSGILGGAETPFIYSKGLGDRLKGLVDSMTSVSTGTISLHQESLQSQITSASDRVDRLTKSVTAYHDRLVKQFAAMEQALSNMKSQYAKMESALGTTTSSS